MGFWATFKLNRDVLGAAAGDGARGAEDLGTGGGRRRAAGALDTSREKPGPVLLLLEAGLRVGCLEGVDRCCCGTLRLKPKGEAVGFLAGAAGLGVAGLGVAGLGVAAGLGLAAAGEEKRLKRPPVLGSEAGGLGVGTLGLAAVEVVLVVVAVVEGVVGLAVVGLGPSPCRKGRPGAAGEALAWPRGREGKGEGGRAW